MKLLVSLCNQDREQAQLPGVFLVEVDTTTRQAQPIPLDVPWPSGTTGLMGLAHYGEDLIAVTQGETALLVRFTRRYQVRHAWPLAQVKDAHSIAVESGTVHVASTGTDAIIEWQPRRGERVFWQDNDERRDTIHLNSLFWHQGRLIASAFGKKRGEEWRSAEAGYLFEVATGRMIRAGVYHPHSVVVALETGAPYLYFCESQHMAVGRDDGQRLRVHGAYTPGLVVTATQVCVGFSRARLTSRSRGGACGWLPGKCGVQVFHRQGAFPESRLAGTINLEAFSHEIYDLLPL